MTEERLKQLQEYMELVERAVEYELEDLRDEASEIFEEDSKYLTLTNNYIERLSNAKAFALFAMKSMISSAKEGGVDECTMENF